MIGAGPNGLVVASVLADAGWSVLVLEGASQPGGAVRGAQVTAPGFDSDLFSAFYPLSAISPVLARLDLGSYGLEWTHAPAVVAHVRPGREVAVLSRDLDTTMASMELGAAGDGERYRTVVERWAGISGPFMDSLLGPFPPLRPAAELAHRAGVRGLRDLARTALMPVRRFVDEEFRRDAASLLLAGNALHADLTPDMSGSALFGWMLVGLGQQVGFPVPVGGAGSITSALVRRAEARGVEVRCGRTVTRVTVTAGRATGVVTDDEGHLSCRAVLADCDARKLFLDPRRRGTPADSGPPGARPVQRAASTFKVDWALSSPVPWCDPTVSGAGTVHIADSLDELTTTSARLAMNLIPAAPFLIAGQMTTADPTRSPPGTESMWAYTHVPQRSVGDAGGVGRYVQAPADLEARNPDLVGGDLSGGTAQLHQRSSSGRSGGGHDRRHRSATCTSRLHLQTRAAACTARAATTPLAPRSGTTCRSSGDGCSADVDRDRLGREIGRGIRRERRTGVLSDAGEHGRTGRPPPRRCAWQWWGMSRFSASAPTTGIRTCAGGHQYEMATTEETFAVPQSVVFAALVDPDTYPHWLIGARRVRSVSEDWPRPKSFFRHTVGLGPLTIADSTTVRAIRSPQMLELVVRARPLLEATVRFDVQPAASGCRLRMSETPIGIYKIIAAVSQPLIRARNERSLQQLRSFVESSGATGDVPSVDADVTASPPARPERSVQRRSP